MKLCCAISLLAALLTGCTAHPITPADVTGPQVWGASKNVTHVRHLYFSEQPDAAALQQAKANGVATVINLREPDELDWDEQGAAEELGLAYINVPILKQSDTLDPEAVAAISAAVAASHGAPVLLHCSSGNRAAAWFAAHLVEEHQLSSDDALLVARKVGLTREDVSERVLTYLNRVADKEQ